MRLGPGDVASGMLAKGELTLRPLDWTCVTYAISENLAKAAELSATRGRSLSEALSYRLRRSIFHTTGNPAPVFVPLGECGDEWVGLNAFRSEIRRKPRTKPRGVRGGRH